MTTLREHLEAIRDRNDEFLNPTRNSDDYRDAVAALAILDTAERSLGDYDEAMAAWTSDGDCRLVPDPPAAS